MKKTAKLILPLLLIVVMSLPVFAQNTDADKKSQYVIQSGKIIEVTEVTEGELATMLWVQGDKEEWGYNIFDTTPVYRSSTMHKADRLSLVAGEVITVFYKTDTPVTASLPPQTSPEVVVLHDSSVHNSAMQLFDSAGLAVDSSLQLNITDETIVVDINGKSMKQDAANNAYLLAFFTHESSGTPPQVSPNKIIVLGHPEDMETATAVDTSEAAAEGDNQAAEEGPAAEQVEPETEPAVEPAESELDQRQALMATLEGQGVHVEDNVKYVKLSEIARMLEFGIQWDETDRMVTLTKENAVFQVFIGQTHVDGSPAASLRNPPIILNDRTYIEEGFIDVMMGV